MKSIPYFLALIISLQLHAQEWQKFTSIELGHGTIPMIASDIQNGNSRHFRINPYTNIPWMAYSNRIKTFSEDGLPIQYMANTVPAFNNASFFVGFEFMPTKIIALDAYFGLDVFENDTWTNVIPSNYCYSMTLHQDSIYLLRHNLPAIKWANGNSEYLDDFGTLSRILVHDNRYWMSYNYGPASLCYYEGGILNYYNIDTCLLMDYGNYEYKFSPYTDTLYVAGEKGLSMLHNNTFFDSIAPDNTTNMPSGKIIDFEFDVNNNIWALFGSDFVTPSSIAHYDQAAKTWDAYYNSGNSALNMTSYGSIELDTNGNVWFAGKDYFYVLALNDLPSWLSLESLENESAFSLFPNPAENTITITSKNDAPIERIIIRNLFAETCLEMNDIHNIDISSLKSGCYFVEIYGTDNLKIGSKKLIVN